MPLQQYSFVVATGASLSIHRLEQTITRDRLEYEARLTWAEMALKVVNDAFQSVKVETWPTCALLLPHALAAAGHAEALHVGEETTGQLLNQVGFYLRERAQFTAAKGVLERALAIRERVRGPDRPDTATSLNNLGLLLRVQGDLAGARPYLERALAIRERVFGPDHPDIARSLNNLGFVMEAQGDLAAARPYLQRAHAIFQERLGEGHPSTGLGDKRQSIRRKRHFRAPLMSSTTAQKASGRMYEKPTCHAYMKSTRRGDPFVQCRDLPSCSAR